MRLRDAFKSAAQCEREGIGEPPPDDDDRDVMLIKDGGDGQQFKEFRREVFRRLNRVEDRMSIQMRFMFVILGSVVFATFVGLVLAFVLG